MAGEKKYLCCSKKCAQDIQKPKWDDIVSVFKARGYDLVSTEYKNAKGKLKYICHRHRDMGIQEITYNNIRNGFGCKYCGDERTASSRRLDIDEVRAIFDRNDMILVDGQEYHNTEQKMAYICKKHPDRGVQYMSTSNAYKNHCPYCNVYKGEAKIKDFLVSHNIDFEFQKKYQGLTGVRDRQLSYDFYVPSYNLLIEYQGQYHDGTARNQSKEDYYTQVEHDRRKRDYAINNNIDLLEIWYYDFSNITSMLDEKLKI